MAWNVEFARNSNDDASDQSTGVTMLGGSDELGGYVIQTHSLASQWVTSSFPVTWVVLGYAI
jgi:hypothetical protein